MVSNFGKVPGTETIEELADAIIERDLPGLPAERREATAGLVGRRLQIMATPIRLGLQSSALMVRPLMGIVGAGRVVAWLHRTRLPFLGDVDRALRYLVVSYVWETWPDTQPDGTPGPSGVVGHPTPDAVSQPSDARGQTR